MGEGWFTWFAACDRARRSGRVEFLCEDDAMTPGYGLDPATGA